MGARPSCVEVEFGGPELASPVERLEAPSLGGESPPSVRDGFEEIDDGIDSTQCWAMHRPPPQSASVVHKKCDSLSNVSTFDAQRVDPMTHAMHRMILDV
jgi:hypothetical protein